MTAEHAARTSVVLVGLGLPLVLTGAWWSARSSDSTVTLHARVTSDGGWLPAVVRAEVGVPLRLRLISDDVVHGFAIGQSAAPPIDLAPGQVVETTLEFSEPGTYTYYCTRWCGPDHWRMRGVIEVAGADPGTSTAEPPLYQTLGIDIDAPHPSDVVPQARPSARRGLALGAALPAGARTRQDFISKPPAETWAVLRRSESTAGMSDAQVWDLVASLWRSTTTTEALRQGSELFAANCAACHGLDGTGSGVFAGRPADEESLAQAESPADFTDPARMLGASTALLQGKILRGGMGTGMPYWGPIFTEAQTWALADYLWTFQFEE